MKINYCVIAASYNKKTKVLHCHHLTGYEKPPSKIDEVSLRKELSTDQSFGLVGKMRGIKLISFDKLSTKFWLKQMGLPSVIKEEQ